MKLHAGCLTIALALMPFAVQAQAVSGPTGMTLYTFDKDSDGKSACYDKCATAWPPFIGKGEKMDKDWTLIDRTDGTKQWAYEGKPTYYYMEDMAAGDVKGDGKNGVWHVLKE